MAFFWIPTKFVLDFAKAYRNYILGLREILGKQEKLDEAEKKVKDTEEKVFRDIGRTC